MLHYFDDMPTADMAEALEIAPSTVLSRLARAREALKGAMAPPKPAAAALAPTALATALVTTPMTALRKV